MRTHTVIGERILCAAPGADARPRGWCVRATSAGTDRATRTGSRASGSRSARASSPSATPTTRWSPTGPTASRMSAEVALEELRRCAGTQFDPRVVEAFCAVVAERALAER